MKLTEYNAVNKETKETVKIQIEEKCCIEHDGHKFCSGGAFIAPDYLVGYVKRIWNEKKTAYHIIITTWHGETITENAYEGSQHPWGYTHIYINYDNKLWLGRQIKDGDLVRAKPLKN